MSDKTKVCIIVIVCVLIPVLIAVIEHNNQPKPWYVAPTYWPPKTIVHVGECEHLSPRNTTYIMYNDSGYGRNLAARENWYRREHAAREYQNCVMKWKIRNPGQRYIK